jgi:FMNH2-dependent dimethyl sulfone monooxygenase
MTNPLYSNNKLKLGTFATNVSGGCAVSTVEGTLRTTWAATKQLAQLADRDGYEAIVPIARWRGFGGKTDFNGACFETYTWAAGLGEATRDIGILTTSHVPTVHPVVAAKQATTVDHITGGRFALNIVCGWFKPELEMFGTPMMAHDVRYDYATEWIEILKLLWTREDEFDYEGKFLQVKRGFSMPKPIQTPFPPLMCAGSSERGRHFAAKYGDLAFVTLQGQNDPAACRQIVSRFRDLARREYGRELQIWTYAYVVQRETQAEADAYVRYYAVEHGDDEAVDQICSVLLEQSESIPKDLMAAMKFHFKAGFGGHPLVGTADSIVAELEKLSGCGIDGVLLSWPNYLEGMASWSRDVMPRLAQAGLRRRVAAL